MAYRLMCTPPYALCAVQYAVCRELTRHLLAHGHALAAAAAAVAELDCLAGLADAASELGYCRPRLTHGSGICVQAGAVQHMWQHPAGYLQGLSLLEFGGGTVKVFLCNRTSCFVPPRLSSLFPPHLHILSPLYSLHFSHHLSPALHVTCYMQAVTHWLSCSLQVSSSPMTLSWGPQTRAGLHTWSMVEPARAATAAPSGPAVAAAAAEVVAVVSVTTPCHQNHRVCCS